MRKTGTADCLLQWLPMALVGMTAPVIRPKFLALGREVYGAVDILYGNPADAHASTIDYNDFPHRLAAE